MLIDLLLQKLKTKSFVTVNYEPDAEITGICPDSSRVEPGNLYIAIEGLRADGHDFIFDAVERGATALAVSKAAAVSGKIDLTELNLPIIVGEDTRALAAYLFAAWHGDPQNELKIVGITGTNGKTSTSRLIFEMLRDADIPAGLVGTMGCFSPKGKLDVRPHDPNANMTTPDPEELYKILRIMKDDGAEVVIMEVTSHALALKKTEPIDFDVAVFTNLTEDHLDFHKDMETYFAAKSRLFEQSRIAVINYDDRYGRQLADNIKTEKLLCSAEGRDTDRYAEDIHIKGAGGIEYKLVSRDLRLRVRSPLCGSFNVMNTMEAAIVAHGLGASAISVKDTLRRFSGIGGRLERVKTFGRADFQVYIDYAHTPDALENLLRTARGFAKSGQRIVLLFGCGGERDRQKRPIMGKIASDMADFVIITSDNSRSEDPHGIISEILEGYSLGEGAPCRVIEKRRDAIEYAVKNARRGDIILLAGKGHEEYEIDREGKKPFSEREMVKEFVGKYC